jgi:hypothetical protein
VDSTECCDFNSTEHQLMDGRSSNAYVCVSSGVVGNASDVPGGAGDAPGDEVHLPSKSVIYVFLTMAYRRPVCQLQPHGWGLFSAIRVC